MDAAAFRTGDLESRRICRFCLRTCPAEGGGLTDIASDPKVVRWVECALTFEVGERDGLPKRICEGCEWLLERFYLFKNQCIEAEIMLKTFVDTGVPLMQYFKPVDFEKFRWKRKDWGGVDVGIQTVEEVKLEPIYEAMVQDVIKQEVDEEDWNYVEEPAADQDQVAMDQIAREFYGTDNGTHPIEVQVTGLDVGSSHWTAFKTDTFDDSSNDTVEFNPVQQPSVAPKEELKPVESYPNFSEEMLLLMDDNNSKSQDLKPKTEENSPKSPSDVIYEDLPTTPLRESDGLPSKYVDMEPGEIVSDDEFESSILISSSDTEDSPTKLIINPVQLEIPPQGPPTTPEESYRCTSCDRSFPQFQLLEAHERAYHSRRKSTNPSLQQPPVQKMAIMIDNPTKRCPKCGTMVHKASYWAHIKSHSSNSERAQLVNYDKEEAAGSSSAGTTTTTSSALEDDFLWDATG